MLEWLLFAWVSTQSQDFLRQTHPSSRPPNSAIIENMDMASLPIKREKKLNPKFLDDPNLSVLAQDIDSGRVLVNHESSIPRPIASLSKIMTFLVIIENHNLQTPITVSPKSTLTEGSQIDLQPYEQISIKTLLEAMLIASANDAARALAFFDSGNETLFAQKMNKKAQELGLSSAIFHNSTGLDVLKDCTQEGCQETLTGNSMSAQDVIKMGRIALKYPFFKATVRKNNFKGSSLDGQIQHEAASTNQLLFSSINSKGIKTGYTPLAKQCFMNLAINPESKNRVITVILGSSNRFEETTYLIRWIWESFSWQ